MKIDFNRKKLFFGFYTSDAQHALNAIFFEASRTAYDTCAEALRDFAEAKYSKADADYLKYIFNDSPNMKCVRDCLKTTGLDVVGRESDGETSAELQFPLLDCIDLRRAWDGVHDHAAFKTTAVDAWVKTWMWKWLNGWRSYSKFDEAELEHADIVAKHLLGEEQAPASLVGEPLDPFKMMTVETIDNEIKKIEEKLTSHPDGHYNELLEKLAQLSKMRGEILE